MSIKGNVFDSEISGIMTTPAEIKQGFKRAFASPWPQKLRYQGDGKPFWKLVVSEATGCEDSNYFEEVYEYYANGDAWHLPSGAYDTMLKNLGGLMPSSYLQRWDEKPDSEIFTAALDQISVASKRAVHVGDDDEADMAGASASGIECWLWGADGKTFADIQNRILLDEA